MKIVVDAIQFLVHCRGEMKNKQIIAASHLIADIDPALAAVWLEQPFRRHDIVTALHQSLSITSAYKHLADGIAVTLRSAIDSTKPCTCHEISAELLARRAFYQANASGNEMLKTEYPNGCSLIEAIAFFMSMPAEKIAICEALG